MIPPPMDANGRLDIIGVIDLTEKCPFWREYGHRTLSIDALSMAMTRTGHDQTQCIECGSACTFPYYTQQAGGDKVRILSLRFKCPTCTTTSASNRLKLLQDKWRAYRLATIPAEIKAWQGALAWMPDARGIIVDLQLELRQLRNGR